MTKSDLHTLNCQDTDCEKLPCVMRREYEQKIDNLESRLEFAKGYLSGTCVCANLADPNDRSKYANYKRLSGHCSVCKIMAVL